MFADDRICADHLLKMRWPRGFVCPRCGNPGWRLATRPDTYQCRSCKCQTSLKAGTVLQGSRLPLRAWFWAAHLLATRDEPVPVRQFQKLLGISYKAAHELRRTLLALEEEILYGEVTENTEELDIPDILANDEPLEGLVQVSRTELAFGTYNEFGKLESDKFIMAVAIEMPPPGGRILSDRIRVSTIPDTSAESIATFVRTHVKPGATLITDGHKIYRALSGYQLDGQQFGKHLPAADQTLGWVKQHFMAGNLNRRDIDRGMGYIRAKLENRRNNRRSVTFETVLQLAVRNSSIDA
jgi:transposase-like protein